MYRDASDLGRQAGGTEGLVDQTCASWNHVVDLLLQRALIEARTAAGLSQSQLARRMKTSQSYVARIEGGKVRPSTDALERFAQATRTRLRIIFEPEAAR